MAQTIILNEAMYGLIINYARGYMEMVRLQEESTKLLKMDPKEVIETTILNATNWEFTHTVEQEISSIISRIGELESFLTNESEKAGFDLRYLTETRHAKYKPVIGNHYVYKIHSENGVPKFYIEHIEYQTKNEFSSKEEVIEVLQSKYADLDVEYELTFL